MVAISRACYKYVISRGVQQVFADIYVMFKTQAAVFYRDLKARGAAEWF